MKIILRRFRNAYIKISGRLAFYPTIISIGFFFLALLTMDIGTVELNDELADFLKPVIIKSMDNARALLGTIIASVFSLLVFSFSMVMVVLNLASSSLSPRVLPGLISRKSHQVVLGVYVGTIVYCMMLLINLGSADYAESVPSIAILFCVVFALVCLSLFVYFIDGISRYIQADSIIMSIHDKTQRMLEVNEQVQWDMSFPDTTGWTEVKATFGGYIKNINFDALAQRAEKASIIILLQVKIGDHLQEGDLLYLSSAPLSRETMKSIGKAFDTYIEEQISDHYIFGFKQLSEISLKALSPGINDPGTSAKAIDKMSTLLCALVKLTDKQVYLDGDGFRRVYFVNPSVDEIFFTFLAPIRRYGREDTTTMVRLCNLTQHVAKADKPLDLYRETIQAWNDLLEQSINDHIEGKIEKGRLLKQVADNNQILAE